MGWSVICGCGISWSYTLFVTVIVQGPELQYLLTVKQDLSLVLIFQHAILNAKLNCLGRCGICGQGYHCARDLQKN